MTMGALHSRNYHYRLWACSQLAQDALLHLHKVAGRCIDSKFIFTEYLTTMHKEMKSAPAKDRQPQQSLSLSPGLCCAPEPRHPNWVRQAVPAELLSTLVIKSNTGMELTEPGFQICLLLLGQIYITLFINSLDRYFAFQLWFSHVSLSLSSFPERPIPRGCHCAIKLNSHPRRSVGIL